MSPRQKLRVVILDDHVTPYRIPLFTRLAQDQSLDILHIFTQRRLPDRQWKIPNHFKFQYQFLPGFLLRLSNHTYQDEQRHIVVNPTLLWNLIRSKPDIIVGYAFSIPTWIAFAYARITGIPFISWSTDTPLTRQQLSRVQRRIRQFIIPRAAGCITPSKWGLQMFESYGADREDITVVTQAADLNAFSPSTVRDQKDTHDPHRASGPIILYVGSLSERKGIEYLLDVLPFILKSSPDAQLLIIGDGPRRDELQAHARVLEVSAHVLFGGYVQQNELPDWYARADVFVFPTLDDRFGVVIAEAAASGLPLVTSKFAAASFEFVQQGENGFIIDPRDRDGFADAIIQVLSDPDRRQRMGAMSRQIAEEKNLDHAARQFTQALHRAGQ